MFRKLTIILCLVAFAPAAFGAQGPVTTVTPASESDPATGRTVAPAQAINLSLPAGTVLMAAAETSEGAAVKNAPEQKKESRSSFNWGNFAEVHLGDYRWVWWAGAAAALIAIHASAD